MLEWVKICLTWRLCSSGIAKQRKGNLAQSFANGQVCFSASSCSKDLYFSIASCANWFTEQQSCHHASSFGFFQYCTACSSWNYQQHCRFRGTSRWHAQDSNPIWYHLLILLLCVNHNIIFVLLSCSRLYSAEKHSQLISCSQHGFSAE